MNRHHVLINTVGAAVLAMAFSPLAAGVTIDDFEQPTNQVIWQSPVGTTGSTVVGDPTSILGGERDVKLEVVANAGTVSTDLFDGPDLAMIKSGSNQNGLLTFNQDSAVVAKGWITWDGVDGDYDAVNPTGLGAIDLTEAGQFDAFGIGLDFLDQNADVLITVWTDADHWSTMSLLLNQTHTPMLVLAEFEDFVAGDTATGPADFLNIGAVQLGIDGTDYPALDMKLDFVVTTASAPEPATGGLIGLGLASLAGVIGRRRRA